MKRSMNGGKGSENLLICGVGEPAFVTGAIPEDPPPAKPYPPPPGEQAPPNSPSSRVCLQKIQLLKGRCQGGGKGGLLHISVTAEVVETVSFTSFRALRQQQALLSQDQEAEAVSSHEGKILKLSKFTGFPEIRNLSSLSHILLVGHSNSRALVYGSLMQNEATQLGSHGWVKVH